jgi:hypothetical protein
MIWPQNEPHLYPNLSRDGEGYIYYKGIQVEHYSFPYNPEGEQLEREALADLLARCVKAEYLGVPVRTGTVIWAWSWFAEMDHTHPYLPLLRSMPSFWVKPTAEHPETNLPNGYYNVGEDGHLLVIEDGKRWLQWDAEILMLHAWDPPNPDNLGHYYHPMTALGWRIPNGGQVKGNGLTFATTEGITAFLERMKVPHGFTLPN